jgi:hypothetical protein
MKMRQGTIKEWPSCARECKTVACTTYLHFAEDTLVKSEILVTQVLDISETAVHPTVPITPD